MMELTGSECLKVELCRYVSALTKGGDNHV